MSSLQEKLALLAQKFETTSLVGGNRPRTAGNRATGGIAIACVLAATLNVNPGWLQSASATAEAPDTPHTFYVSKSGNNTTGTSMQNAFSELNRIKWKDIPNNSTIVIDGGVINSVYRTALTVPGNKAVTVVVSTETGHTGRVEIAGSADGAPAGIIIESGPADRLVTIEGSHTSAVTTGIHINHFQRAGVLVSAGLSRVRLRGLYISNVGNVAVGDTDLPDVGAAVLVRSGSDVRMEKSVLQDNPFDIKINSETPDSYFQITDSLLFRSTYNLNRTSRAVQIADVAGTNSQILVQHCVIGPGLNRGIFNNSGRLRLLSVQDCLFISPARSSIRLATAPRAFDFARLTSVTRNSNSLNEPVFQLSSDTSLDSRAYNLNRSVFYGGTIRVPTRAGLPLGSNNIQFRTAGMTILISGEQADPLFNNNMANLSDNVGNLIHADYGFQSNSPALAAGAGSTITSVLRFLQGH